MRVLGSGRARGVGPYPALNFPWILIDRAMGTLACVALRSHARRDSEQLDSTRLRELLAARHLASSEWAAEDRQAADACFERWRRGRAGPSDRLALGALLRRWMSRLDTDHEPTQAPQAPPRPTMGG